MDLNKQTSYMNPQNHDYATHPGSYSFPEPLMLNPQTYRLDRKPYRIPTSLPDKAHMNCSLGYVEDCIVRVEGLNTLKGVVWGMI